MKKKKKIVSDMWKNTSGWSEKWGLSEKYVLSDSSKYTVISLLLPST